MWSPRPTARGSARLSLDPERASARANGRKCAWWRREAKDSRTTFYGATFGSVEKTGRRWGHVTRAAGWGLNSRIHTVGDGAEWIQRQSQEVFGEQAHFLCDFFHVSEYLAAAAPVCRPKEPEQWRHTQQKRLKRGAVPQVIAALAEHLEPQSIQDQEAPVRQGHRYLSHRLDALDYPRRLGVGLADWLGPD